jgi:hypothetical protein
MTASALGMKRLVWDLIINMQVSGEKTRDERVHESARMNSSKAFSTSREKFLFKFTVFCLMRRLFVLCRVKERGLRAETTAHLVRGLRHIRCWKEQRTFHFSGLQSEPSSPAPQCCLLFQ